MAKQASPAEMRELIDVLITDMALMAEHQTQALERMLQGMQQQPASESWLAAVQATHTSIGAQLQRIAELQERRRQYVEEQ